MPSCPLVGQKHPPMIYTKRDNLSSPDEVIDDQKHVAGVTTSNGPGEKRKKKNLRHLA